MFKIYNTLTKTLENFSPIDQNHVKIYVCGPTVYDKIHIGNARPLVVFDILVRLLRFLYPKVTYVRNITDVDDKINQRLISEKVSLQDLTKVTIRDFKQDSAALVNLVPDYEPKATDHISEMIEMIEKLISKGFAYVNKGNVLFNVKTFSEYGNLSKRLLEDMISGSRIEVEDYKINTGDFVLWKPSEGNIPGWESPWGKGRPGWHIECSAMSKKYLGKEFDIHGGGADLVFPHHENEIAQSRCANDTKTLAKYWVHNGYVNIDNEKMSKSLKNFITISDLLKNFKGETIRYFLLQAHYRAPLNFSYESLKEANSSLSSLYRSVKGLNVNGDPDKEILNHLKSDINSPSILSRLHYLSEQSNKGSFEAAQLLKNSSPIIGLLESTTEDWFKTNTFLQKNNDTKNKLNEKYILELIDKRTNAKSVKDFKLADEIRNLLYDQGILLEDKIDGTDWRYK